MIQSARRVRVAVALVIFSPSSGLSAAPLPPYTSDIGPMRRGLENFLRSAYRAERRIGRTQPFPQYQTGIHFCFSFRATCTILVPCRRSFLSAIPSSARPRKRSSGGPLAGPGGGIGLLEQLLEFERQITAQEEARTAAGNSDPGEAKAGNARPHEAPRS